MDLCPQLRRLAAVRARWRAAIEQGASGAEEQRCPRLLALWDREVLPHCRAVEEILLPELAQRRSEADAAIVLTLSDHVALRRLVRELRHASGGELSTLAAALAERLAEHAEFEERTLLPLIQEALGSAAMAALAAELTPSRQSSSCTGPTGTRRRGSRSPTAR